MEKQVKLHIDTELWHRAKIAAAKDGVTLKTFCAAAILLAVHANEKSGKS